MIANYNIICYAASDYLCVSDILYAHLNQVWRKSSLSSSSSSAFPVIFVISNVALGEICPNDFKSVKSKKTKRKIALALPKSVKEKLCHK